MNEKEKQMFCQLLDAPPEWIETLEVIAKEAAYDSVREMIRHAIIVEVYSIASYRDRHRHKPLHDILSQLTKKRASLN